MSTRTMTLKRTPINSGEVAAELTFPIYRQRGEDIYAGGLPYMSWTEISRLSGDGMKLTVKKTENTCDRPSRVTEFSINKKVLDADDFAAELSPSRWESLAAATDFNALMKEAVGEIVLDLSSEEFGKEIANLMSDDLPVGIEEAPAWNSSLEDLPSDRDVWAYVSEWDGEDKFSLVRGRREGQGEDAYLGDHDLRDVVAWIDVEVRPEFSLALVKAAVAAMERLERHGNGHAVEAWLHREALRAVVAGHPDAHAIAAAALESRDVKFTRYYS